MISEYSLRPVACDQLPFKVTHLNPFNEAKTKRFQNRQKFYREETEEQVIKIPKNLTMEEQIQYLKDFQEKQAKRQQNSGQKQGESSEPSSPDK